MSYVELIKTLTKTALKKHESVVETTFDNIKEDILSKMDYIYPDDFQVLTVEEKEGIYKTAVREYKSVYPIDLDDVRIDSITFSDLPLPPKYVKYLLR